MILVTLVQISRQAASAAKSGGVVQVKCEEQKTTDGRQAAGVEINTVDVAINACFIRDNSNSTTLYNTT